MFAHNTFIVPVWPFEEFVMMVGESRASAIRKVRVLLYAEAWLTSWLQLDSPVKKLEDVAGTLR